MVYGSTMDIKTTNCKIVILKSQRVRILHLKYEIGENKEEASFLRILDYHLMLESGIVTLR